MTPPCFFHNFVGSHIETFVVFVEKSIGGTLFKFVNFDCFLIKNIGSSFVKFVTFIYFYKFYMFSLHFQVITSDSMLLQLALCIYRVNWRAVRRRSRFWGVFLRFEMLRILFLSKIWKRSYPYRFRWILKILHMTVKYVIWINLLHTIEWNPVELHFFLYYHMLPTCVLLVIVWYPDYCTNTTLLD